jgi:uncharacterized protein (DUF1501 family)
MLQTRREFLRRGAVLAAAAGTVPTFLARTAEALAAPSAKETDRILVLLQLAGGNDGLNTLIPFADDAYYRARPQLAVPAKDVVRLDDRLGLHPELAPVKALYDEGLCAIFQGVGYPNPDRSHFRSMEIWETASGSDKSETTGWIGRFFDANCPGCDRPTAGVAVGSVLPQSLKNRRGVGVAVEDPEQFRTLVGNGAGQGAGQPAPAGDSPLDFLQRTAMNARLSADAIAAAVAKYRSDVEYPQGQFSQSLRLVAQMIAGGLPSRVYFASLGGFDTHAGQSPAHPNLLRQFGQGVSAFLKDLRQQGNADRVLVVQFSEFGRRVAENASGGTDHGTAAPMFAFGKPVKAGLHGAYPNLADLDQGDLKHTIDFRRVYAAVLRDWLATKPEPILGGEFPPVPLLG